MRIFLILCFAVFTLAPSLHSKATLTELSGVVEIQKIGDSEWYPAMLNMPLEEGDRIRTGKDSSAEITFDNGQVVKIEDDSDLTLSSVLFSEDREEIKLKALVGKILANVKKALGKKSKLELHTPTAVIAVRGTEYVAEVKEDVTDVAVFDGNVSVNYYKESGEVSPEEVIVKVNEQVSIRLRQRPTKPYAITPRMLSYKARLERLRERAERNRKRIKEIIQERERVRAEVVEHWQKLRKEREKRMIEKLKKHRIKLKR